mgnify:CR=1 FL=1
MSSARAIVTQRESSFRFGSGKLIIATFILAQCLDILSTHLGLSHGAVEVNPLGSRILAHFGEPGLYLFKSIAVAAMVVAVATVRPRGGRVRKTIVLLTCLVAVVVFLNLLNVAVNVL